MSSRIYRIGRALLIPLALVAVLLLILLLSPAEGFPAERIVLAVMFLTAGAVFCEAASRRVTVADNRMTVRKFLRTRALDWEDITHLGALVIRRKAYILLTTKKGLYIFSNAYGDFHLLVRDIAAHVGAEKVEPGVVEGLKNPLGNHAPVFSLWGAAIVIAGIVAAKLLY